MRSLLFFLVLCVSGSVYSFTGNDLHNKLRDNDSFAMSYVTGVARQLFTFGDSVTCVTIPKGVTAEQVVDIVRKYLQDNPDARHMSAEFPITLALFEAFGGTPKSATGMC